MIIRSLLAGLLALAAWGRGGSSWVRAGAAARPGSGLAPVLALLGALSCSAPAAAAPAGVPLLAAVSLSWGAVRVAGVDSPTGQPTSQPSGQPSGQPTNQPTNQPTGQPSAQPTGQPSGQPSTQPTGQPSRQPTQQPSSQPSVQPTGRPSAQPSTQPTSQPSRQPTQQPSAQPSRQPTSQPSRQPSQQPTARPSCQPSARPSAQPSSQPAARPSSQPTQQPTSQPSTQPTSQPSLQPSIQPSSTPTNPTGQPTQQPSRQPTSEPTSPTGQPSTQPSAQPSRRPSSVPTGQPTGNPTSAKFLVVSKVQQRFTGLSYATYKSAFDCGTSACTAAKDKFDSALRTTVASVLGLTSTRQVQGVTVQASRRRLQQQQGQGQGQGQLQGQGQQRELLDSITVLYTVQTASASMTADSLGPSLQAAVSSGAFTLQLRLIASNLGVPALAAVSAGDIIHIDTLKTSSPVITPTVSPTVQTPYMFLRLWYIPWSVACAVLGTAILYGLYRLYLWRQKKWAEQMHDLESRRHRANELLAKRFAPGITSASAPHITKMRDNFKRQYGRDPASRSPYDERDVENSFLASPLDQERSYYTDASGGGGGSGGKGGMGSGRTGWGKTGTGTYPTMSTLSQASAAAEAAGKGAGRPGSPLNRVKTVLQLGDAYGGGGGGGVVGSRGLGLSPGDGGGSPSPADLTLLSGEALRKLVQSERTQNRDYRYTLALAERETTARMTDLLESRSKPSAKEMVVLQKYARDLLAENDKMARQLERLQRTGTYTGSGGNLQSGSPSSFMLTGSSGAGGSSYAPVGVAANRDALKRGQTGRSPGAGGGAMYTPSAKEGGALRAPSPRGKADEPRGAARSPGGGGGGSPRGRGAGQARGGGGGFDVL